MTTGFGVATWSATDLMPTSATTGETDPEQDGSVELRSGT